MRYAVYVYMCVYTHICIWRYAINNYPVSVFASCHIDLYICIYIYICKYIDICINIDTYTLACLL